MSNSLDPGFLFGAIGGINKKSLKYETMKKQFGILSGLIWVQTVCKSYQQTTLGDKELSARINVI